MDRRMFCFGAAALAGCGGSEAMEYQIQNSPITKITKSTGGAHVEGSWTPELSFLVPGNLSVTYARQQGHYIRIGSIAFCFFVVETTSFTHTTASGNFLVTGLPFEALSGSNFSFSGGNLDWAGITKAGYTDITTQIFSNSRQFGLLASASASPISPVSSANVPSGADVRLEGFITYQMH